VTGEPYGVTDTTQRLTESGESEDARLVFDLTQRLVRRSRCDLVWADSSA